MSTGDRGLFSKLLVQRYGRALDGPLIKRQLAHLTSQSINIIIGMAGLKAEIGVDFQTPISNSQIFGALINPRMFFNSGVVSCQLPISFARAFSHVSRPSLLAYQLHIVRIIIPNANARSAKEHLNKLEFVFDLLLQW